MDDESQQSSIADTYNVERAIGELVANLLRVMRGSGQPHLLVQQVAVCNQVFERHFARHKEWPEVELKRALDPGLSTFPPEQKLLADESQHYALAKVVEGALQVVASHVQPNPAMRSRGLEELLRGIDQLNAKRG